MVVFSLFQSRANNIIASYSNYSLTNVKSIQLLFYVAALMLPQGIFADPPGQIQSGYATELEAVQAAANLYNPLSIREDREYLGTIEKYDDGYRFSVKAGTRFKDRMQLRVSREAFALTVALWHTHGNAASHHRYFSDTDTRTATQLNLPFYLADYTGYLKVYRPGNTTLSPHIARRLGLGFNRGYAIGEHVLDRFQRPIKIRTRIQ